MPAIFYIIFHYFTDFKAAQSVDIIGFNKYYSWYDDTGHLELIKQQMEQKILGWKERFPEKPLMITEYGGDTIAGMHTLPAFVFSEDYQFELMKMHFKAFDAAREKGFGFIGEMIWNFADFMTKQEITRVGGNKKGIFTRQRQPKAAAHLLRRRYFHLAETLDNVNSENGESEDVFCPL